MRIDDGFSTLIEFSLNPGVKLWEKEVTPPGMDGGGQNDTTTMRNTTWRTFAHKGLITLTPITFKAAYDPTVYNQLRSMINRNQLITCTFSDGSVLSIWGWLNKFQPGASSEGSQPTADVEFVPSNQDNSGDEAEPIMVESDTGTVP